MDTILSIDSFPPLQIAAFALKTAKDTIPALRSHHERCNQLIERCQHLIVDVCGQVKPNSSQELLRQLKIVERTCVTVRDTITSLQNKGTVWRALNKDNINRAFTAAEVELSDAFLIFNVGAHITHNKLQNDLANALQNDRLHIMRYLDHLLKRSQILADAFENRPSITSQPLARSWSISPQSVVIGHEHETLVGVGSVGKVIKGRMGRKSVAMKKIHRDISRILSSDGNKRILEAKFGAWKRINHPNVAEFFGSFVDNEHYFLVSEYFARGNILDYVLSHPDVDRISLLHQICSGMEHLHENMIIHGNLKTSNLLVGKDHTVIVGDYDLTWLIDDAKMSGPEPTVSSWIYMSPEYLDGGDLEYHVDVYSFAITAWVLHTGCIPFSQVGWRKLRQKVVEKRERPHKPESMHTLLWTAIEKWWAHDPDERPTFVEIESFLCDWHLTEAENVRPMTYRRERARVEPIEIINFPPQTLQLSPSAQSATTFDMDFGPTIPISKAGQRALRESLAALEKFTSIDKLIRIILLHYPTWLKNSRPKARGPRPDHIYEDGVESIVNRFKKAVVSWIERIPHLQGVDVANGNRTLLIISSTCVMAEHTLHKSSCVPYVHTETFIQEKLATSELRAFLELSTRKLWSNYQKSLPRDEIYLLESLTHLVEHGCYISAQ